MKKALAIALLMIIVLISSGCKSSIHFPILWFGPDDVWQTFDVAIAVGPDGGKHILWADCNAAGNCRLTYQKTFWGDHSNTHSYATETWSAEPVPYYHFPDISVAEDGIVYFVWNYRNAEGYSFDCWNHIHADDSVHDTDCHALQDVG